MRIDWTGKIDKDFYALGFPAVPVYMLDGESPALFDTGFTALSKVYEREIKAVLGDRQPAYLFLTHAHFDHVGAAGYFKRTWPEMCIVGSAKTQEIISRPRAIERIRHLNQEGTELFRSQGLESKGIYEGPFQPFDLDIVLAPGEEIELEGFSHVKALSTPGHTWDFTSYWLPERKILIASEAVGSDDGSGYVVTEFLVDYDIYRESMERLRELDAEILCPGHQIVFTGPEVKRHIDNSLKQADEYVGMVEEILRNEQGDIERTVEKVKAREWDPKPWPKQPESAYLLNTRARVQRLWERMQRG